MNTLGLLRITRPVNSVVAGIAVLLGYIVAAGRLEPEALVLIPVVACITAAGNVVNDYSDREIDQINRPDRPIPSGAVTPGQALVFSGLLFLLGILLALSTNPLCVGFAVLNSLLLVLYAVKLKGLPFIGNLGVAYLSASIFLFGGAFVGLEGLIQNVPIAGITFLAMISRELFKDVEDMEGDAAGGARTLPMVTGMRWTVILAFLAALGAVIMSYLPLVRWWGLPYIAAISAADLMILYGAGKGLRCHTPGCVRSSGSTGIIKAGMFLALAVFIGAALLA